jgi:hypothetical protein
VEQASELRLTRRSGTPGCRPRKNYNGKRKKHGLLFLALTDETGNLIWISGGGSGSRCRPAGDGSHCLFQT